MCKHRFGVHLLQNPPLCSSTVATGDTHPEIGSPAVRWGHINWGKKYFVLGWPEHLRQDKSLLYQHRRAQRTNQRRTPFHLYSLSPYSPRFHQSAGPTPLWWQQLPMHPLVKGISSSRYAGWVGGMFLNIILEQLMNSWKQWQEWLWGLGACDSLHAESRIWLFRWSKDTYFS